LNRKIVVDAGVLSLHFVNHRGVREYFDAIITKRSRGLISSVNLAEFYYKTCQKLGGETADFWYFQVQRTTLEVVYNNEELVRRAALEKCKQLYKLALADCFALALAKIEGAMLLTTDDELAGVKDVESRYIKP
jgi:predicted nucleic acid-binding protein